MLAHLPKALLISSVLAVVSAVMSTTVVIAASHAPEQPALADAAVAPPGDPCIVYSYEANGNRLSQAITASGGGLTPTWGTGTWGCFKWTP